MSVTQLDSARLTPHTGGCSQGGVRMGVYQTANLESDLDLNAWFRTVSIQSVILSQPAVVTVKLFPE